MPPVCRSCSRVNPASASFCYFDGVALDAQHQGGPVAVGVKPFPSAFIFPSGRSCRNFNELVSGCDEDWTTAQALLYEGLFEGFLGGLGRADLAMAARQAVKETDRDQSLEAFLNKLPVNKRATPKLGVQPLEVNLGLLTGERQFNLRLDNQGAGLLSGTITGDDTKWLAFGEAPGTPKKHFQCRQGSVVPVHVLSKNLRASNKPIEGRILIESSGGTASVTVKLEKPVKPFPDGVLAGAKLPREIASKAKAHPKEAALLFEKGAVKDWYEANGWTYPVQGPSSSGLGAIQQFFEALGLVQAPKVTISQQKLQFSGRPGESVEQAIQVQTAEKRPVYAHATTNTPWLQAGKPKLGGRIVSIPIRVTAIPSMPGERLHTTVQVTANGNQRFTVEVELNVTGDRNRAPIHDLALISAAAAYQPVLELSSGSPVRASIQAIPDVQTIRTPVVETMTTTTRAQAVPTPPPAPRRPRSAFSLLHGVPVVLLLFFLAVPCVHDGVFWLLHLGKSEPTPLLPNEPVVLKPDVPRLELQFHDKEEAVTLGDGGVKPTGGGDGPGKSIPAVWEPSMRFGVRMIADEKGNPLSSPKSLTFQPNGTTNNAVVRLDNAEYLFGERPFRLLTGGSAGHWPGRWQSRDEPLGNDANGKPRRGRQSVWYYDDQKVAITQIVEIVKGSQSGVPDTVLVRYVLKNEDNREHRVGIRFLLDTFIGSNDGVPFLIPGQEQLCTTKMDFDNPATVPDFIQAREFEDLSKPGTIAQVQLKTGGGLDAPDRVTLGAWPNPELMKKDSRCRQEKTMWEVPVLDIHSLTPGDSAVTLYWYEKPLAAGATREVGFAYGLGAVSGGEGQGKLAVTVGGSFLPEGEFTVTAYLSNPVPGQTVTLTVPKEFRILDGADKRPVPKPGGTTRISPVTWKVRGAPKPGTYPLKVDSSTGASQSQPVKIMAKGIFGSN